MVNEQLYKSLAFFWLFLLVWVIVDLVVVWLLLIWLSVELHSYLMFFSPIIPSRVPHVYWLLEIVREKSIIHFSFLDSSQSSVSYQDCPSKSESVTV